MTGMRLCPIRPAFTRFIENLFAGRAQAACEVSLLREDNKALDVQLTGPAAPDGQECRVILSDITERIQAQPKIKHLASIPC